MASGAGWQRRWVFASLTAPRRTHQLHLVKHMVQARTVEPPNFGLNVRDIVEDVRQRGLIVPRHLASAQRVLLVSSDDEVNSP